MADSPNVDTFINHRDPALAIGDDGQPARSPRARHYVDVPDEQWDDWRWQLSNRVNDLEDVATILELSDEERAGLGAPDKFRVDITPYFISLIDAADVDDPIRRQVMPLGSRAARTRSFLSLFIPIKANGFCSIRFTSDRSCGYRSRQGPHQWPQKSRTTTLPR